MKISRENYLLSLIEFLFAALLIFSVAVNLKQEKQDSSNLKLPGRYLITMQWSQDKNLAQDDLDLHAVDSQGNHAWFADPTGGPSYLALDSTDDTGEPIKYYTDINTGALIACDFHEERITIYTCVEGEYIVSVYCYNKRLKNVPTKVVVTLIDLKNNSQIITKNEVELSTVSEQKVGFRFSVDKVGNIIPGSLNYKPYLLQDTKRAR